MSKCSSFLFASLVAGVTIRKALNHMESLGLNCDISHYEEVRHNCVHSFQISQL